MNFKCVVIDDEQYAVDAMAKYIADMPGLTLFKTFTSSLLAESLRSKTRFLIFITSHAKHALTAFDLQVNQYLLKPISFAKFALTINFLLEGLEPTRPVLQQVQKKGLQFIKADQKNSFHYIDPEEILFIQAAKNYVHIYTDKDSFVTHMGLNHIEAALAPNNFIRISKSYIIAKNAIRKIEGNQVRLKNNETFQIGETYKSNFTAFIKENMIRQKP